MRPGGGPRAGRKSRLFNAREGKEEMKMSKHSEMIELLRGYGNRFVGNDAADAAEDWDDCGFSVAAAAAWCEIGCWDAATAHLFVNSGLTPDQVCEAAQRLIEACDDPAETYTDGDPIYAACNNDINVDVIIAACER